MCMDDREIQLIKGSELQKLLEPLFELKAEITALNEGINKKSVAKFLTIPQVCALLHVSRSTIYRMVRNGDLKAKKAYKRVLFFEKDIEKFLITVNQ